jgi:hypothetical protein
MTLDIQSYGVLHIGVDNYFTVFRKASEGGGAFPTDAGLTLGVLPFEKFQMEAGVDLLEASDDPLYFNAKMGTPEGVLFHGSPALELGIFNVGTKPGLTNQNIVHFVAGKTIRGLGRLSLGPYIGNGGVLVNSAGEKANDGFMVAFDRGFVPVRASKSDSYNRIVLAADYASGENAFGGGGVGIYYYVHPDVSLLAGPVWFNDEGINGQWKWTFQLDVNRFLFGR